MPASTNHDDWAIPREEAIPRLLDEHGPTLYGLSRRICGSPEEAEDLVQEVFLNAWRGWDEFEGRSTPVVWLFTIARHACQRMHRKRSGEPEHLESLEDLLPLGERRLAVVPADGDGVEEQTRRERQDAAGQAISALPVDFRMALVLKEIIGFTVEEVSEILGVNASTVKTRLHRARLKVRKALESGLPREEFPPIAYPKQVCLDLLQAKQEAIDRGVDMPNADNIICDRCNAVFATLDLASNVCHSLAAKDVLPRQVREALVAAMQANG